MEDSGLVTLKRFASHGEANIYKALLESAGIMAILTGEYANDIYPMGESWASIDLQVRAEDAENARTILAAKYDIEEFKTESSKQGEPENG